MRLGKRQEGAVIINVCVNERFILIVRNLPFVKESLLLAIALLRGCISITGIVKGSLLVLVSLLTKVYYYCLR